jgi:hypothetical protein
MRGTDECRGTPTDAVNKDGLHRERAQRAVADSFLLHRSADLRESLTLAGKLVLQGRSNVSHLTSRQVRQRSTALPPTDLMMHGVLRAVVF